MAVKKIEGSMNVVDAARQRLLNIFSNGVKVYLAFSGGKDTLCLCSLVYDLIMAGKISAKQLCVVFIDEEALYRSMFEMAIEWRKRFISLGAEFRWYCLPVYQMSMLRSLQDEESWITWEPGKEDVWIRQAPPFAILRDPALEYAGQMNYQAFLPKVTSDGLMILGVRAAESVQRMQYMASTKLESGHTSQANKLFPIYDWKDNDVWLYIKEHHLHFPEAYINLYRVGVKKQSLRLCQFFGHESIAGLRYIAETDPDLWDRIQKREPNAYLALLYWDSEMFHRSTRKRAKLEADQQPKDYKALCKKILFDEPEKHFTNPKRVQLASYYRRFFITGYSFMQPKHFKKIYEALMTGDPKRRTLRAIYTQVFTDYVKESRQNSAHTPQGKGVENA